MGSNVLEDGDSSCLKCEREFADGEVTVSVLWWVGYEAEDGSKNLTEQVIYRYCYLCARRLDLENLRVFQLDKARFRLEGALELPNPETIATCSSCGADIMKGSPFAKLRVVLDFQRGEITEELCELFQWIYCTECAPRQDLDNIYILETETPVDLLQLAQSIEKKKLADTWG